MTKETESADGKSKHITTERTVDNIKGESVSRLLSEQGRDNYDEIDWEKKDDVHQTSGETLHTDDESTVT